MDNKTLDRIHFKTYCWSVGTTSFRMKYFNLMIEQQLRLLKDFFNLDDNINLKWNESGVQERYYEYIKANNFVKGDAKNKAKDARQKTSGLVDIGLIDSNRRLTEVGEKLLEISVLGEYKEKNNNFFGIDNDSYIYMLQLLKMTTEADVRPFVVLIKVLIELNYITFEEFTYILPLVMDFNSAAIVVDNIKKSRKGYLSVDDIMLNILWSMDNYKAAYEYFIKNDPTVETFKIINMNRKSSSYEVPYALFYELLVDVYVNKNKNKIYDMYKAINGLSGKAGNYWKKLLFNTTKKSKIKKNGEDCINDIKLSHLKEEYEIKKYIFEMIHLFKWKATLADYSDLNRRYFSLSDLIIFEDDKIQCNFMLEKYFKTIIDGFFNDSFKPAEKFGKLIELEKILGDHTPNMEAINSEIAAHFGEEFIPQNEILEYVSNERLERFNKLIDHKFTNENLLILLDCFEKRKDEQLTDMITDNANPPTMFEYILGIIWYNLSGRKGNILNYMNLSLDANLLPKSHAAGGEADIVYQYAKTEHYPEHELLLEATLADNTNQRRMEMEPVSRHLLRNLESTKNLKNYAVLVSTTIHPSVVSDFRSRATTEQTLDYKNYYKGIKLLPLETKTIKKFIKSKKTYNDIYQVLDNAYRSTMSMQDGWYQKEIEEKSESSK